MKKLLVMIAITLACITQVKPVHDCKYPYEYEQGKIDLISRCKTHITYQDSLKRNFDLTLNWIYTPVGNYLIHACSITLQIYSNNWKKHRILKKMDHLHTLRFRPDGAEIAAISMSNVLYLINTKTFTHKFTKILLHKNRDTIIEDITIKDSLDHKILKISYKADGIPDTILVKKNTMTLIKKNKKINFRITDDYEIDVFYR